LQYGELSANQIIDFTSARKSRVKEVTYEVWIEDFGDVSNYVISINTDRYIDNQGLYYTHNNNVAQLICRNESLMFYDGSSLFKQYSKIKISAGFNGLTVPIFTGIITNFHIGTNANHITLFCSDNMALVSLSNFIPEMFSPDTIYNLVDKVTNNAGLQHNLVSNSDNAIVIDYNVFNNTNGDLVLDLLSMSLCGFAFFDESGILNVERHSYRNDLDLMLDDDSIISYSPLLKSQIINDIESTYSQIGINEHKDQNSIDSYGIRLKKITNYAFNIDIKDHNHIYAEGILDISSDVYTGVLCSLGSGIVDTIAVKMFGSVHEGYLRFSFYTQNESEHPHEPDEMIIETGYIDVSEIPRDFPRWVIGKLINGYVVNTSVDDPRWVVVENRTDNGVLFLGYTSHLARDVALGGLSWTVVEDYYCPYWISGSVMADNFNSAIINSYKEPKDRKLLYILPFPELQLLDTLILDSNKFCIYGHNQVTRILHNISKDKFGTTIEVKNLDKE